MKKIKDLGMRFPTESSKQRVRYFEVYCPQCKLSVVTSEQSLRKKPKTCRPCADLNRKDYCKNNGSRIAGNTSDKDCIYVWNLVVEGVATDMYKIGITSSRLGSSRFVRVSNNISKAIGKRVEYNVFLKKTTVSAKYVERLLLSMFKCVEFDISFDGEKEVVTLSGEQLEKVKIIIDAI